MNDLFPVNDKIHKMKTRDDDKYKVKFANTGRLKNSSIISMQNMLNENEKNKNRKNQTDLIKTCNGKI